MKGYDFNYFYLFPSSHFTNSFLLSLLEKQEGSWPKVYLFFLFPFCSSLIGRVWHYEVGTPSRRSFCLFWRETKQRPELEIFNATRSGQGNASQGVEKRNPEKAVGEGWRRRAVDKGQQKEAVREGQSELS